MKSMGASRVIFAHGSGSCLLGFEVEHHGDDVLAFPKVDPLVGMNNLDLNHLNRDESLLVAPRCFAHKLHPNTRMRCDTRYGVFTWRIKISRRLIGKNQDLKGETPDRICPARN